jgi:hypothetical protein
MDFGNISPVESDVTDELPPVVHPGVPLRDTALVDRLIEGLRTLASENALGILLGPFGRFATIGTEAVAVGELELLIHRIYAECNVLASLRGPALIFTLNKRKKIVTAIRKEKKKKDKRKEKKKEKRKKKGANLRLGYKLKDGSRTSLLKCL